MKIAIPLAAGKMSEHFGHAEQFVIIEADTTSKQIINTTHLTPPAHEPGVLCHAGFINRASMPLSQGEWASAPKTYSHKAGLPSRPANPVARQKNWWWHF